MQRNIAKSKPKSKLKKGKQPVTVYNRDVICLPSSYSKHGLKSISIPRGNSLIRLAEMGLQGKVTFNSTMNEEEIFSEIRSAFAEPMGQNPSFPFTFLQASGSGTKSLAVPSLSFHWTTQEVCKLGKTCIYILAEEKLANEDVKVCLSKFVFL